MQQQKINNPNKKIDTGTEQTVFQRRLTIGQQGCEKVLSITNPRGNANQNHSERSLDTCQDGFYQKNKRQQMLGGCGENGVLAHCTWNVNWYRHCGKQYFYLSTETIAQG